MCDGNHICVIVNIVMFSEIINKTCCFVIMDKVSITTKTYFGCILLFISYIVFKGEEMRMERRDEQELSYFNLLKVTMIVMYNITFLY